MSLYRSKIYLEDVKAKLDNGDMIVVVYFSEILWLWKCNICGMPGEDRDKIYVHAMGHLR
jgi:hypothetical protein